MVSEDKSYFVQGEVGRQGRFRLSGVVTLLKAISEAGGYSPFANRKNVKVIRGDEVMFFNARDIAAGKEDDPVIQANDIIEVLRSVF
jgi:polysaccharide export outer membrane protein